jgi:tRNA-Thr(GGU) m(6)t(6)A37 methyltransferase TsaA
MNDENTRSFFKLHQVGRIEKEGKSVSLHIFKTYKDALKGLDGFSHVFVLYWFDRNDTPEKRSILQVHPRGNKKNPITGVFACRSPVRPNLIALSLCKIVSVEDGIVHIDKIDALNNSPILDLKPYIPNIDHIIKDVHVPDWLNE